jgi:phosphopantetheine adenylyltransferase
MTDRYFIHDIWNMLPPPDAHGCQCSDSMEVMYDGALVGSVAFEKKQDGGMRVLFCSEAAVRSVLDPNAELMRGVMSDDAVHKRNKQLADALDRRTAELSAVAAELKAFRQAAAVQNERGTALIKAAQNEVEEATGRATDAETALALSKMTIRVLDARVKAAECEPPPELRCGNEVSTDLAVLCPEVADLINDAHRVMVEHGLQRDLEHLLKPLWDARERFAAECQRSGVQRCHNCPDYGCGDNLQVASQKAHENRGGK